MKKTFTGTVMAHIHKGMKVRIKTSEYEGKVYKGKEFIVDSEPRDLCGTEVVALRSLDGSRFTAAYDISMLEITDSEPDNNGCSDHGCIFDPPTGMGTNGGCRCLKDIHPQSVRIELEKKIRLLKNQRDKLQEEVQEMEDENRVKSDLQDMENDS